MFFLIQISKFCKMMQVSVLWYLSRLSFKSPVSAFPKLLQNTLGEAVNIKYLDNWHDCLCIHYSGLCSSSIKDKFLQFSPFLLNIFCCHRVFQRCFLTGKKVFAKFFSNTNDIDATVITCWVWSHIKKKHQFKAYFWEGLTEASDEPQGKKEFAQALVGLYSVTTRDGLPTCRRKLTNQKIYWEHHKLYELLCLTHPLRVLDGELPHVIIL